MVSKAVQHSASVTTPQDNDLVPSNMVKNADLSYYDRFGAAEALFSYFNMSLLAYATQTNFEREETSKLTLQNLCLLEAYNQNTTLQCGVKTLSGSKQGKKYGTLHIPSSPSPLLPISRPTSSANIPPCSSSLSNFMDVRQRRKTAQLALVNHATPDVCSSVSSMCFNAASQIVFPSQRLIIGMITISTADLNTPTEEETNNDFSVLPLYQTQDQASPRIARATTPPKVNNPKRARLLSSAATSRSGHSHSKPALVHENNHLCLSSSARFRSPVLGLDFGSASELRTPNLNVRTSGPISFSSLPLSSPSMSLLSSNLTVSANTHATLIAMNTIEEVKLSGSLSDSTGISPPPSAPLHRGIRGSVEQNSRDSLTSTSENKTGLSNQLDGLKTLQKLDEACVRRSQAQIGVPDDTKDNFVSSASAGAVVLLDPFADLTQSIFSHTTLTEQQSSGSKTKESLTGNKIASMSTNTSTSTNSKSNAGNKIACNSRNRKSGTFEKSNTLSSSFSSMPASKDFISDLETADFSQIRTAQETILPNWSKLLKPLLEGSLKDTSKGRGKSPNRAKNVGKSTGVRITNTNTCGNISTVTMESKAKAPLPLSTSSNPQSTSPFLGLFHEIPPKQYSSILDKKTQEQETKLARLPSASHVSPRTISHLPVLADPFQALGDALFGDPVESNMETFSVGTTFSQHVPRVSRTMKSGSGISSGMRVLLQSQPSDNSNGMNTNVSLTTPNTGLSTQPYLSKNTKHGVSRTSSWSGNFGSLHDCRKSPFISIQQDAGNQMSEKTLSVFDSISVSVSRFDDASPSITPIITPAATTIAPTLGFEGFRQSSTTIAAAPQSQSRKRASTIQKLVPTRKKGSRDVSKNATTQGTPKHGLLLTPKNHNNDRSPKLVTPREDNSHKSVSCFGYSLKGFQGQVPGSSHGTTKGVSSIDAALSILSENRAVSDHHKVEFVDNQRNSSSANQYALLSTVRCFSSVPAFDEALASHSVRRDIGMMTGRNDLDVMIDLPRYDRLSRSAKRQSFILDIEEEHSYDQDGGEGEDIGDTYLRPTKEPSDKVGIQHDFDTSFSSDSSFTQSHNESQVDSRHTSFSYDSQDEYSE